MSSHQSRTMSERMIDQFMKKAEKQSMSNSELKLDFQELKKVKLEEESQRSQQKEVKGIFDLL